MKVLPPDQIRPFTFSDAERDRRWSAVRAEMAARGLDALVVQGSFGCYRDSNQNLQWLTNVNNEGYLIFPADGEPTMFSFENGLLPTWVPDWRGAIPNFAKALITRFHELGLERSRIGTVQTSGMYGELNGFPWATYTKLQEAFPQAELVEATDITEEIRKIKSDEEVRAIVQGCEAVRHAFDAIRETAAPGVRDYEIRAVIMDTLFRNGCDQGGMILYCQGPEVMHGGQSGGFLEPPFPTPLAEGDVILLEIDGVYLGYKGQVNTAFTCGEVDDEWHGIFETASISYQAGLDILRPGITIGQLEDAFLAPLRERGYIWGNPAFHGLGLGVEQPMGSYPRVNWEANRDELVRTDMVFEFEPHPCNRSATKGASVGCPVRVTADGCEVLTPWFEPKPIPVGI